jgi:hypothetical protein
MSVVFCECNVIFELILVFPGIIINQLLSQVNNIRFFYRTMVFHRNKEFFDDRIFRRNVEIPWPSHFCDLSPYDFFVWPYLKNCVFQTPVANLYNLQQNS